mgnify:CR=1 FL=1
MKAYRGVKFMTGFINYLINGISLGSVYAIIALGSVSYTHLRAHET